MSAAIQLIVAATLFVGPIGVGVAVVLAACLCKVNPE